MDFYEPFDPISIKSEYVRLAIQYINVCVCVCLLNKNQACDEKLLTEISY